MTASAKYATALAVGVVVVVIAVIGLAIYSSPTEVGPHPAPPLQTSYCDLVAGHGTMESRVDQAEANPSLASGLALAVPGNSAPPEMKADAQALTQALNSGHPEDGRAAARALDADAATRCH